VSRRRAARIDRRRDRRHRDGLLYLRAARSLADALGTARQTGKPKMTVGTCEVFKVTACAVAWQMGREARWAGLCGVPPCRASQPSCGSRRRSPSAPTLSWDSQRVRRWERRSRTLRSARARTCADSFAACGARALGRYDSWLYWPRSLSAAPHQDRAGRARSTRSPRARRSAAAHVWSSRIPVKAARGPRRRGRCRSQGGGCTAPKRSLRPPHRHGSAMLACGQSKTRT